jgi:Tol biopolymer transport system component
LKGIDPRTRKRLRVHTCLAKECFDNYPAWSRDGRRLAFTRQDGTDNPAIWVSRPDGSHARELLANSAGAAWAPDGLRVAIVAGSGSDAGVYWSRLAGEPPHLLVRGGVQADWSARDVIAVETLASDGPNNGRSTNIVSVRPDGSHRRSLTRDGLAQGPSWSPSGRSLAFEHVAFTKSGDPRTDVYVTRADGRRKRRVIRNGRAPVWSPDGKYLAFVRNDRYGDNGIYLARADGSRVRRVYRASGLTGPSQGVGHIAWRALPPGGRSR